MNKDGKMDSEGLQSLIEFQLREGVSGILAVGTTGESATLDWKEHNVVIEKIFTNTGSRVTTIAGTGSNCTKEALEATEYAWELGVRSFLLVDPYYNGPSSLEIRKEYIEPVARRFPDAQIIPYVIPGRTGTQLLPQDLALLHSEHRNVRAVKEATGNLENMKLTRKLCGEDFDILSGDDEKTLTMMTSPKIHASGVVSVASNVVPRAVQCVIQSVLEGDYKRALSLSEEISPLFGVVTVKTKEENPFGQVVCKARNPLPYKTLMNILGMPSGPCRQPLGKMTRRGLEEVLAAAKKVYESNPKILEPIENFFDVDMTERLYEKRFLEGLYYS
jgi:4-hydroxy-tetrahydrodipicolinate synthase